ncbi:hypothetical protein PAAG_12242 [Paracoccidioides lutzii Pb01]|uniref:DNA polymerase delta subunit 3 n=1 Tax=Paracoccidioides lutzii (strain ATCC MYA-826 / Pb01) TaxID=502779 RepID=A0A0A2VJH9_PARBA|nr:hypothetical protein PAAG_12242 [Paracoccidioides lutzii Pb01]KGQ01049.1 hypothetical protein PAAG_12242 [Paracoccidioides lutzii Pb01]
MAASYKKYLAEKVINEQEIVTYRSLSRALKVHSNLAKRMLYEFHRVENSKKPQSVHATYLITGTQLPTQRHHVLNGDARKDGDDDIMQCSPFMSSQTGLQEDDTEDSPPVTSITLVREEDLSEAKSQFQKIFSIFVHSVQPTRVQDLNIMSDIGHDILESQIEDPLEYGKIYGMILNKNVMRRSGVPPPAPPPAAPAEAIKIPKPVKAEEPSRPTKQEDPPLPQVQAKNATSQPSSRVPSRQGAGTAAESESSSLKRGGSGNIFQAFARSKAKVKKETPEVESVFILDDSSEEEREDLFLDTGTRSSSSKRESRREREEKLRKMMDEDEEMADAPEPPPPQNCEAVETLQSSPQSKAEEEEEEEEGKEREKEKEASVPATKGRRRGRRQVMKKTTVMDEDGFLVTEEQPVWESFSEDEAPSVARRKLVVAVHAKPAGGRGGAKTGQGSIMSFFGKNPLPSLSSPLPPHAIRRYRQTQTQTRSRREQPQTFGHRTPDIGHQTAHAAMKLPSRAAVLALLACQCSNNARAAEAHRQHYLQDSPQSLMDACPDYAEYSAVKHGPYSDGPLKLPFQRPVEACRTFVSPAVEQVIEEVTSRMVDKDLAQIFRNAFPNTLDTTVRWHTKGSESVLPPPPKKPKKPKKKPPVTLPNDEPWQGPQSFIVTGDINAEWLRDSANQLTQYQSLAKKDPALQTLIHGAINTQTEFILQAPYCNAFQPPPPSKLNPILTPQHDIVHPAYERSVVFECKYELDSLASFLALSNKFYASTQSTAFVTPRWYRAVHTILRVIDEQSQPTFDSENGRYGQNEYTFLRQTTLGTETLNLGGIGNPLNNGTGLVRSAFRPSDDATIFGFFIPANAQMAVELRRTADTIRAAKGPEDLIKTLRQKAATIERGIREYGIVRHPRYGHVYAYEVDGYGSQVLMDDANLPSLLSLPLLGFGKVGDDVYRNTRRMVLEKTGNPYYLVGEAFEGIGGPHVGLQSAWPMSVLIRARTSTDDEEIIRSLNMVRNASVLGLVHESVNVNNVSVYTRSWFAWANSVFAQTILDLAERKPEIVFGKRGRRYRIAEDVAMGVEE